LLGGILLDARPVVRQALQSIYQVDLKNGESVMALLKDLHMQGATICMVTHDPRYAELASRTIHLFDGRIVEANTEAA
jgi:putative ABC transport system ATP-binding protein